METNRIIAKLYYSFFILYFLRKIKNKLELAKNLFALLCGNANFRIAFGEWKCKIRDMYDLLALKEVFDDEIYRFVFEGIKDNTTLIDLGAYIGDTEIYAQQFPEVRHILALEPMPENFKLAKENILLNKIKNASLLQYAIAKRKGIANLFIHPNKGQSGFWKKSDKLKKIKVKTMTLTDVINLVNTPHIILKCDCEGAEYEMFMDTPINELSKFQKMAFEYHEDEKLIKIIVKLEKTGFTVRTTKHPVEPDLGTAYAEKN